MPLSLDEMRKGYLVFSTLEKIRQELDPSYCYIVFERTGPADRSRFFEVFELLIRIDLAVIELKSFYDRDRGTVLLVVKLESGRADAIMERIIGAGLSVDIGIYGYGSSQTG